MILDENRGTGVQQLIDRVAFELLGLVIVYPVEDEKKLSDHFGNILPDAHLFREGDTCNDLAVKIHTDLIEKFICAIDAKKHMKVGREYVLKNGDVIKIVANR
ncbi:MAG: TGS domain-containing protein [Candidatus Micrarchaeota archaeon]